MKKMSKIIVIVGPTASGKTELGIKLAKKFDGEVVSADSRQVYRGMDVGTAKPCKYKKSNIKNQNGFCIVEGIRHYLIDVVNPDEEFTVAIWKMKAVKAIKDILKRKKLPIIVGGTGLYIEALVDNLDIPQVPPDLELRKKLELRIKNKGLKSLYQELLKCDPDAEGVVDPYNPRRVIRALEVCLVTGKPFTSQKVKGKQLFDTLQIGISLGRNELYRRIDKRVEEMFKQGLIEETRNLLRKYRRDLPSMSGIGYKEVGEYLEGKIELKEAIARTNFRTHAYARRQMTWFKRDKRIKWVISYKEAIKLIKGFLATRCRHPANFA